MLKKAIIKEVNNNRVSISLLIDDCAESEACHECGMCGKNKAEKNLVELEIAVIQGIHPGDLVEVDIKRPNGSLIALVIYLMPLLFMFLGGFIGNVLGSELGMILGGVAGLGISLIVIHIFNMTILRMSGRIIRVL